MSISPFIEDDVSCLIHNIFVLLHLSSQKSLLPHYANVNIQEAIAVGTSLIQVMDSSGVSSVVPSKVFKIL